MSVMAYYPGLDALAVDSLSSRFQGNSLGVPNPLSRSRETVIARIRLDDARSRSSFSFFRICNLVVGASDLAVRLEVAEVCLWGDRSIRSPAPPPKLPSAVRASGYVDDFYIVVYGLYMDAGGIDIV